MENGKAAFPDFDGLSSFWDEGAEYVALYPNVLFAAQRDHAYAMVLTPTAKDRTVERVEIYYAFDPATRPELAALIEKNAALWHGVLEEDLFVVEGMQAGRYSPGFDGGKFSPAMDGPTHRFHQWAATQLKARREGVF